MSSFVELFPATTHGVRPVVILDGGMGTTLQSAPFDLPLNSLLWSSELLGTEDGREQLGQLHQTWVDHGAEIIGSCTYQSSLPLFLPSLEPGSTNTYSREIVSTALETMLSALPLVVAPYSPSPSSLVNARSRSHAALSLGSFGANCTPASEYTGLYPEPYGSSSTSKLAFTSLAATYSLPSSPVGITQDPYEDSLTRFHLARLEQFATCSSFNSLSIIAFETSASLCEIRAIRRAMGIFERGRESEGRKFAWYISCVFPIDDSGQARFPDPICGKEEGMDRLMRAIFGELVLEFVEAGEGDKVANPGGIGINCTHPLQLGAIIKSLSHSLSTFVTEGKKEEKWIIIYPDGGAVYDVNLRAWSSNALSEQTWAEEVVQSVRVAREGKWGGVIVGGCCKAGPGAIAALRRGCEKEKWL